MKLLWPADLVFTYERWNPDAHDISQWFWVLCTLAAGTWLWRARHRLSRDFLAGIGFYIITIFPLLGFVSDETFHYSFVADHYQYLASLGLITIWVGSIARLFCRKSAPGTPDGNPRDDLPGAVLCSSALLLLGALTWQQCGIYRNTDQIWTDTLRKNPSCWLAHDQLGDSLCKQGKTEEAVLQYRAALRLNPYCASAHDNWGVILSEQGKVAEAITHYREALRIAPGLASAQYNLGVDLAAQGKAEKVTGHYRASLRLKRT
jgi:tetratricopeptide (TPR) repeat protein